MQRVRTKIFQAEGSMCEGPKLKDCSFKWLSTVGIELRLQGELQMLGKDATVSVKQRSEKVLLSHV